jgi:hypothetical protein
MAEVVVGPKVLLDVDPVVNIMHNMALQMALDGCYSDANEAFGDGLAMLSDRPDTLALKVQAARLTRDRGFTYNRSYCKASSAHK